MWCVFGVCAVGCIGVPFLSLMAVGLLSIAVAVSLFVEKILTLLADCMHLSS